MQGPARPRAGLRARGGDEGHGRPGHQVKEPGVGSEVDPRRIRPRVEEDGHQDRRQDPQGDRQGHTDPAPRAPSPVQQEQEHQRPDQVELLLDRQRPRVLQRRGRRELGEVGLVRVDGVPVVHVEQGGDGVAPQAREVDEGVGAGGPEMGVQDQVEGERANDEEEGRQQPPRPPSPEGGQVDAAGAAPLLEQQRGDEEARQHEEQIDSEVPTRRPTELEVVRHHPDDGGRAQAVQGRQVLPGDGSRLLPGGRQLVDEGGVSHGRSTRQTVGSSVGRTSRSTAAAAASGGAAPPVRSSATRGPGSSGHGRLTASCTG